MKKRLKKLAVMIMTATMLLGGSSISCLAWSAGASSGSQDYNGSQERAYVSVWTTNGVAAEMEASVTTYQRIIGGTQIITRKATDYSESTNSVRAQRNADSGYRIYRYTGFGKANGNTVVNIGNMYV